MKVLKKTISLLLTFIIICFLGIYLTSIITSASNHGVPKIFGYQFLVVQTDSMEPTLPVSDFVLVKDVEPETLRAKEVDEQGNIIYEGDIVTFINSQNLIVTHRLLDIEINEQGKYIFEAFGDNMSSSQCNGDCSTYPHDYFTEDKLLGKVVFDSLPLGQFYSFIRHPLGIISVILVIGTIFVCITVFEKINEKGDTKQDEKN